MKKRICMTVALMTALTMTACSSVPEITGTDYTVEAPIVYDVKSYIGKIETIEEEALCSWAPTKENTVFHAGVIVEGTVISSAYTSFGAMPWTQLDVVVNECYDGELCAGDAVSVYYRGGYMPIKDYNEALYGDNVAAYEQGNENGLYHVARTFEEAPAPGSTFLFFISKRTKEPEEAYNISNAGKEGVYKKIGDGVYYCDYTETEWTVDELYTLIETRDTAVDFEWLKSS